MKLGILGTGMIVKDLMNTYHEFNIEKTIVLGTKQTEEETKELVETYHLDGYVLDYDELLNEDVDTIYVALPNHLHYSFSKKALEHGKHVIIEKPITANSKELKDLMEIAKKNHLIILEAMNIPYLPTYKSVKEHLDDLGNIKIVSFNYSQYSSRYNAFKEGTILPAFDYHKSGGALMDINVYNISTVIGLFGRPENVKYNANIACGIDTSGILTLDYGTFQAVCIGAKDCQAPVMNTIQGDQGFIQINVPISQSTSYTYTKNKGEGQVFNVDDPKHRLYYEYVEFVRIINELDFDFANEMLEKSLIISEVMEEARKQAGIVFDNDKS